MNCICWKRNEQKKDWLNNIWKKTFSNILLQHTLNDKIEKKEEF
jgi:hypothetical protein